MSDKKCLSDNFTFASVEKMQMMIDDLCEFAEQSLSPELVKKITSHIIAHTHSISPQKHLKDALISLNLHRLAGFVFIPTKLQSH